jgi:hypothetical protein
MTAIQSIPWLFSLATAVWFARMAYTADRNPCLWAVMGGAISLVSSTLILGVAEAVFIPTSHEACITYSLTAVLVALLGVVGVGWCVSSSLHAQHRVILKCLRKLLTSVTRSLRKLKERPHTAVQTAGTGLNARVIPTMTKPS